VNTAWLIASHAVMPFLVGRTGRRAMTGASGLTSGMPVLGFAVVVLPAPG